MFFARVNRADRITGEGFGRKSRLAADQAVRRSRRVSPGIAAPTIYAETCAKTVAAPGGGELEQIQMLLGHAFPFKLRKRYLGTKQDLVHAPNDAIKLRVAV